MSATRCLQGRSFIAADVQFLRMLRASLPQRLVRMHNTCPEAESIALIMYRNFSVTVLGRSSVGDSQQHEFVLYHAWNSSASRKVRLAMAEKGLTFKGLVLDLNRFQHHSDWYKRLNPSGIVPCLVVDGHPLIESNLINEYLDEAHPAPPLMPDDPF